MRKYTFLFFISTLTLFSEVSSQEETYHTQLIWIALFALGIISMIMMFILSQQRQKITKHHKKILENRKELEETQSKFLNSIKKEMEKLRRSIVDKKHVLDETVISENSPGHTTTSKKNLLNSTESLIGYLKLKSENLEIKNQSFNLNNMLNELAGSLATTFPGSDVDLVFDMNNNVPKVIIGDSVHIGQILNSIVAYCIAQTPRGVVTLELSLFNAYEEAQELQFKITDSSMGISKKEVNSLFLPEYNEETQSYKRLDFFVAKELITLMNGDLTVQSTKGKGNLFILTLPFTQVAIDDKRKYRLPHKKLTNKKVLIVDDSYHAGLAAKKMFTYFKHRAKVLSSEAFTLNRPNMANYDIVMLNEKLFEIHVASYLKRIKEDQDLKVIALQSIFKESSENKNYGVIDRYLMKPFSQEQVFEMIVELYETDERMETIRAYGEKNETLSDKGNIQKDSFIETPNITIESFKDFSGSRILIVEDNIINQKVLQNILGKAGMYLKIANNGQEAVDAVKQASGEFDMVLMDINMPILDGYEATKTIREEYAFDVLPIVALSALVLENEIQKMFQSGVNGYLQKPLNIGMLYSAFDLFIGTKNNMNEVIYPMVSNIYGININQGIAYTNENIALYKEVLDEFVSAYGNSYLLMEEFCEAKQYDKIERLCLDMKGLTGTIGAYKMHDLVDRIQRSLFSKHYAYIPELVHEYKSEFPKLSTAIRSYIR